MADNDKFVSPYLLRPLRTLERVLGGRGRALEPEPEKVKGRPGRDRRGDWDRAKRWIESSNPSRS